MEGLKGLEATASSHSSMVLQWKNGEEISKMIVGFLSFSRWFYTKKHGAMGGRVNSELEHFIGNYLMSLRSTSWRLAQGEGDGSRLETARAASVVSASTVWDWGQGTSCHPFPLSPPCCLAAHQNFSNYLNLSQDSIGTAQKILIITRPNRRRNPALCGEHCGQAQELRAHPRARRCWDPVTLHNICSMSKRITLLQICGWGPPCGW